MSGRSGAQQARMGRPKWAAYQLGRPRPIYQPGAPTRARYVKLARSPRACRRHAVGHACRACGVECKDGGVDAEHRRRRVTQASARAPCTRGGSRRRCSIFAPTLLDEARHRLRRVRHISRSHGAHNVTRDMVQQAPTKRSARAAETRFLRLAPRKRSSSRRCRGPGADRSTGRAPCRAAWW